MSKLSSSEVGVTQQPKGVSVYRRVLNMPEANIKAFGRAFGTAINHEEHPDVKVYLRPEPKVMIVGPGEIRRIQELLGIKSTVGENDELAQHLNKNLPYSANKKLKVTRGPVNEYPRLNDHKELLFTVAAANPILLKDREIVQDAVDSFYEIDRASGLSHDEAWLEYDYKTDLALAGITRLRRNTDLIKPIKLLLEREIELIPPKIELDIIKIDAIQP